MRRVLTKHALRRFRRRVDRKATDEQVQAELDAGELRATVHGLDQARRYRYDQAGYVVTGRAVFPVIHDRGVLVARTALRPRRRRSKADRRAWREQQRDGQL